VKSKRPSETPTHRLLPFFAHTNTIMLVQTGNGSAKAETDQKN